MVGEVISRNWTVRFRKGGQIWHSYWSTKSRKVKRKVTVRPRWSRHYPGAKTHLPAPHGTQIHSLFVRVRLTRTQVAIKAHNQVRIASCGAVRSAVLGPGVSKKKTFDIILWVICCHYCLLCVIVPKTRVLRETGSGTCVHDWIKRERGKSRDLHLWLIQGQKLIHKCMENLGSPYVPSSLRRLVVLSKYYCFGLWPLFWCFDDILGFYLPNCDAMACYSLGSLEALSKGYYFGPWPLFWCFAHINVSFFWNGDSWWVPTLSLD